MASVLMAHMGESFQRLSPLLQQVHDGKQRIEGIANVQQGNWAARIICRLFQFPKANPQAQLSVDCEHTENTMHWKRNFDGLKVESHFTQDGDFLIEYLGPLALSFKAIEKDRALHYQFIKTRLWGIPMPNVFSPQVIAYEQEYEGRYRFSVNVTMFLIGSVIRYGGELQLIDSE